jgi:hypothetical protein
VATITAIAHGLRFPEGPIAMSDGSIVLDAFPNRPPRRATLATPWSSPALPEPISQPPPYFGSEARVQSAEDVDSTGRW